MPNQQAGDLLIRPVSGGMFEVVDVTTQKFVAGPFDSLVAAIAAARERNPPVIWQQNVDARGRPLGDPFQIPIRMAGPRDLGLPSDRPTAVKGGRRRK